MGYIETDWDPVQYLGYCTGCNSCNSSHRLNLMLRKLTCHMSKLAIRVLQISPISLLFSVFTSAAVYTPNLNFRNSLSSLLSLSSTRVFLSASLSLTLFSALFSTPTVPPAQPLLRLAGFDKSGLDLVGLPQNPQISFRLYHPHSALSFSKSSRGCQFQLIVVCHRWSPIVRFWFGSVLGAHYFGCSSHFSKVFFLKFIFKNLFSGFLRVFLGNGKCNGCKIMLIVLSLEFYKF